MEKGEEVEFGPKLLRSRSARKNRSFRREEGNGPEDRRSPRRNTIERRRHKSGVNGGSNHNQNKNNEAKDGSKRHPRRRLKSVDKLQTEGSCDNETIFQHPRRRVKSEENLEIDIALDEETISNRTMKARLRERRNSSRRGKTRCTRAHSMDAVRPSKSRGSEESGKGADVSIKHRVQSAEGERSEQEFDMDNVVAKQQQPPKEPRLRPHRGRSPRERKPKTTDLQEKNKTIGSSFETNKGRRGLSMDVERLRTPAKGKSNEKNRSHRGLSIDAERMQLHGDFIKSGSGSESLHKSRRGHSADAARRNVESGQPRSYRRKIRSPKPHDDNCHIIASKKSSTNRRQRQKSPRRSPTRFENTAGPSSKDNLRQTGSGSLSNSLACDDENQRESTVSTGAQPIQSKSDIITQEPDRIPNTIKPFASQMKENEVEHRGKGGILSQYLLSSPLRRPQELEERSETSHFTNTYQSTPALVQFDPTNINNFTTVNQQQANVTREDIKLADGTRSELHISELHDLPTFDAEQSSSNSSGSSNHSPSKMYHRSLPSLGSFESLTNLERPNSSNSIEYGANAGHRLPITAVNQSGRRGRGLVKSSSAKSNSNTAGRQRGIAANHSFFSRLRTQTGQLPPRKQTPTRDIDSSNASDSKPKSFFGNLINQSDQGEDRPRLFFNREDFNEGEESKHKSGRFFFNREDFNEGEEPKHKSGRFFFNRELEHQALDDDGESDNDQSQ